MQQKNWDAKALRTLRPCTLWLWLLWLISRCCWLRLFATLVLPLVPWSAGVLTSRLGRWKTSWKFSGWR
eukprot:3616057-Karenia_brevis.AAC.1